MTIFGIISGTISGTILANKVCGQFCCQFWGQFQGQLEDNFGNNLKDNFWDNVWDNFEDNFSNNSSFFFLILSGIRTECPSGTKCVAEFFCNENAIMVAYRVNLTPAQKKQRGSLTVSFSNININELPRVSHHFFKSHTDFPSYLFPKERYVF